MEQKHGPGWLRESTTDTERDFSTDKRKSMDLSDFGDPEKRAFPVLNQDDLDNAARLLGHADNPAAVKKRLISIAKRKGLRLPDSWKEDDAKESVLAAPALGKTKVATLTTTWLEDGAVSLNGRQYPAATVDRLIQSAQVHLSTPGAAPLTCYISHEAADRDDSLKLAGKITQVWREGTKAKARIDLVNTEAGRTMATQAAGGFLRTMSLRASNAEIQRQKDATWPIVAGSPNLDGIDFTATPGIDVAKIEDVALAENAREGPQRLHEVFNAHAPLLEMEQKEAPMDPIKEDVGGNRVGGYAPTSGNTVGMTSDAPDDAYHQRQYQQPDMTSGPMAGMDPTGQLKEAHDRAAMIQGRSCAPGRESADWGRAFKSMDAEQQKQYAETLMLQEAGRAISSRNDKHLDVIHDSLARHLGMAGCVGEASKPKQAAMAPANDGMQDGDDDDQESRKPKGGLNEQKEQEQMTPDEAAKLLEAAGWKLEKPRTPEDLQREQLEAQQQQIEALKEAQAKQLAALQEQQNQKLAELQALIASQTPDPQRRSLVMGANTNAQTGRAAVYQPGRYLKEQLNPDRWVDLADRTCPLPKDFNLELALQEMTNLRIVQSFDRYGWPENLERLVDRS